MPQKGDLKDSGMNRAGGQTQFLQALRTEGTRVGLIGYQQQG